jgi:hypothetical protein
MTTYAVFHDWYDPERHDKAPACHTGEFVYLGTAEECAKTMETMIARHPGWRFSVHRLPLTLTDDDERPPWED